MIGTLLKLRFRSMLAGFTSQANTKGSKGKGFKILLALLGVYVAIAAFAMMWFLFDALALPYHMLGLDWLYFAMAGVIALGFSLLGSVFATQSQLYDAKDNALLLSMPIKPGHILLSRMLSLLGINLLFAGLIIVPAFAVYLSQIAFSWGTLLCLIPALLGVTVFAQALACLLGWVLHLILGKCNRSVASLLFMVVFLGLYFWIYSQANDILMSLTTSGAAIAGVLETWIWPLYALGRGCSGEPVYLLGYSGICAAVFFLVYLVLAKTFLASATASQASKKRRKLELTGGTLRSPTAALVHKELKKFLGTPIFLTNMGLGLILTLALGVLGVVFRGKILSLLTVLSAQLPGFEDLVPMFICAILLFLNSTCCLSTPTVSLEGKNIWIPKTMPIPARTILQAKLLFHLVLTVPVSVFCALILGIVYRIGTVALILTLLIAGLSACLNGTLGLWAGLRWAKLDYISEAHPCKQSMAVLVSMFGMMGLPVVLGFGYWALDSLFSPTGYMALVVLILTGASLGLYRIITTWGIKRWNNL
ncbi:MAG: hypothetical protein E7437_09660 [Ruminococcaceae bacterium]|nr:hypothetical protein [Oscillospiraceae bacterium]